MLKLEILTTSLSVVAGQSVELNFGNTTYHTYKYKNENIPHRDRQRDGQNTHMKVEFIGNHTAYN